VCCCVSCRCCFYILSPSFHAPKRDHILYVYSTALYLSFYQQLYMNHRRAFVQLILLGRRRRLPIVPFVCFISSRYSLLFVFFSFFLFYCYFYTHTEQHIQLYVILRDRYTTAPILYIISLSLFDGLFELISYTSFIYYSSI
jgi:hypothetical protein